MVSYCDPARNYFYDDREWNDVSTIPLDGTWIENRMGTKFSGSDSIIQFDEKIKRWFDRKGHMMPAPKLGWRVYQPAPAGMEELI